jgi:hypothetical protein
MRRGKLLLFGSFIITLVATVGASWVFSGVLHLHWLIGFPLALLTGVVVFVLIVIILTKLGM